MRVLLFTLVGVYCIMINTMAQRFWVATTSSNWNNTANWSLTSGGAGGATVPVNGQEVRFDAMGTGNCLLDVDVVVNGISMVNYPGVLDLNDHNFTTTGTNTFASGIVSNGNALIINTTSSTTFSGTVFNTPVSGSTGRVFFNGSTFNDPVTITKTSSGFSSDESTGNNTFNGVVNITTTGHGIIMGKEDRDQFNDVATFTNNGIYRFQLAYSHSGETTTFASDVFMNANKTNGPDGWAFMVAPFGNSSVSFGGDLFIDCAGSQLSNFIFLEGIGSTANFTGNVSINITNSNPATKVYMGINGTSAYQGDIQISNVGGSGGVLFNTSSSANATLAAGRNILVDPNEFLSGELRLSRFHKIGAADQSIILGGDAMLTVGPNSQFDGNVVFTAPRLKLDGAHYLGTAELTKTGDDDDSGGGGNVFDNTVELTNTGSGHLLTGYINRDIFNEDITATTLGAGPIYLANKVAQNEFHGNVILNSVDGGGVYISSQPTGGATFDANSTISIGAAGFNSGVLKLNRLTLTAPQSFLLNPLGSAVLALGQGTVFLDDVTATAPGLLLDGATYNGTATLTKTGSTDDDGRGGNSFATTVELINEGSGYLLTALAVEDIFNGNLTVTTRGDGSIFLAHRFPGTQFNGNVIVNSVDGGGVAISSHPTGGATFHANSTISIGDAGFNSGVLQLNRLTLTAPQSFLLNPLGSAVLALGQGTVFLDDVTATAPGLLLDGATYNGTATLTKTGSTNDIGNGGNAFANAVELINEGSGYLLTAYSAEDIFNGNLTVTTRGEGSIFLAHRFPGTQFNGNVIVNSVDGGGIFFSNTVNGSSVFGAGSTLTVGDDGFNAGVLRLFRTTLTAAQTILLNPSGSAILTLGQGTVFLSSVTATAPGLLLSGATYHGAAELSKTGTSLDKGSGGNTFNTDVTLLNSGTGYLMTADKQPDFFNAVNGSLTVTTTNSGTIRLANSVEGTMFNGNIILNSNNGGGIYFSNADDGSSTLANGRTLTLGIFNDGELKISRFVQSGTNPLTLNLTGNNTTLELGPSTTFPGNVDFRAGELYLNGISVGGTAYLEKTGSTSDTGLGGNIFSGATAIVNSGSGDLSLGNNLADVFSGDLTASNTGSARILLANNSPNNIFSGNVIVNSTSGSGIYFCNGTNGTASFSSGLIQVGSDGFSSGQFRLRKFTQTGNTPQTITLSGSAILVCGPQTTLNGNVDFSAPGITLENTTFNGNTTSITKTGSGLNSSVGGNTFASATTTITNSGTGTFRLADTNGDTFSGNVTFSVSSGGLEPAYNATSLFTRAITANNTVAITFGAGTGTLLFGGSNDQSVNRAGTAAVTFRRFILDKGAGNVTLNTPVNVSTLGTFTNGNIITTATNLLNFSNDAIASGGSNASYVDGPVRKTGNDAFSFPTGNNGVFRPIAISAPGTASHHFTAQYFKENQAFGTNMATGIQNISGCEYWILDRTGGNSNVAVTLSWNSGDCTGEYINDLGDLRVVRWNGTTWVNHGNGSTTGDAAAGSVTSDGAITSFSPFTIGSSSMDNPLPIELTAFSAQQRQHEVFLQWTTDSELNNDYFTIEKSKNGSDFENLTTIKGAGTSVIQKKYEFIDIAPFKHHTYYRLKQTDFDGQYSYSKIIVVYQQTEDKLEVYPNPATSTKLLEVNKMGRFVVFNNLGVIVLRAADTDQLDISKLATGVYVVKSETGEQVRLIVH